jgi:hypothetical protein
MEGADVHGKKIRLTEEGLTYGEEFLPLEEIGGVESMPYEPHVQDSLFHVTVVKMAGYPLVIKDLSQETAERLTEALRATLRQRIRG